MRFSTLLLLAACKAPDAVPDDLDALLHYLWVGYDGDMEGLDEAVAHLHAAVDGDAVSSPVRGVVSRLGDDEIGVPLAHAVEADAANGFMLVDHLAGCTLDALAPVVAATDQADNYPGSYDAYVREYTSDPDAFLGGAAEALTWTVYYETSNALTGPFVSNLSGGVRRVELAESAFGAVLFQRTWLHEPAVFENGSRSFTQDYQLEVYWERAVGEMNHVIAVWREMDLGIVSSEDDVYVNTVLANLKDWDAQTARLCRGEAP